MKNVIFKLTTAVLMGSMLFSSCTKDFTSINTDPNATPIALPEQLMAPALVSTLSYNMLRNRNFNNELMQVTVDASDAEGKVFRYDYRATWADYLYNGLFLELTNFKDMYKVANDPLTFNPSYKGISVICQSWIYSILTDTYGDIPYFHSNLARDSAVYEPPFDAQKDIYMDIFRQLDSANVWLAANQGINGGNDPVFNGNVGNWRRFGNSLYLRLLLRVSGKAEMSEFCRTKFKQIVDSYPVMTSNAESAILRWTGQGPYTSPLINVREQDFRSPGIASFFIDNLSAWNDPRIDIPTYGTSNINRWGIAPYSGSYQGIPSGYAPGENPVKKCYFYSNTSAVSLMTEPMTGMMMNYAELQFILAEAAIRGWIPGSAQTYYETGAQNSITLWLPQWAVPIKNFLAAADIEWDDTLSFEDKMERIHRQKYYALFLVDMQQWFEYRRTGHPILPKGAGLKNGGVMPARMTYPVYVQSTNPTNYKLAVARQGPDQISTQVWWQKP
ncbi:SusD/RagB family nutrient-binding outer membrane lipoprotein [Chitinophaga rhizophila]|uniref:SusD/RagB family nutrient-binding outer membrane lipoprotein n=1 Tax=Chitinophaga rhizophila TaxID=2866212 RepID=A0ABS7G5N6_9BACT|nr:SusD/RagB family nutrient-binding outer membrane lipoprotein [Chitinophaga rhizophila]MBW8682942.1 SusD/RagB family nutrient-binding outer membrane lipoprotein [Chitinophaga rhizophila]